MYKSLICGAFLLAALPNFANAKSVGPGSGSGNNFRLADFYARGDLAIGLLKDKKEFQRPDGGLLPIAPILEKWKEFRDEKIKVDAVFDPIYDSLGRRISIKNDPAGKVTTLDWRWAEAGQDSALTIDGYIFRAVLGQLSAELPLYEDIDRGLSNLLAKEIGEKVSAAAENLRFYALKSRFNKEGDSPEAESLYRAFLAAGIKPEVNKGAYDLKQFTVEAQLLRCDEKDGSVTCLSWPIAGSYAAIQAKGAAAASLLKALRKAFPALLTTEENGTRTVKIHDVRCEKIEKSDAECSMRQTPRIWPALSEAYAIASGTDSLAEDTDSLEHFLRTFKRVAFEAAEELSVSKLTDDTGKAINPELLIEKLKQMNSGAIKVEITEEALVDERGVTADVITIPELGLTRVQAKRWDRRSFDENFLRMVMHEAMRHLEKSNPEFRDVGYRLSRTLTNQTFSAVGTRLMRRYGKITRVSGALAEKISKSLESAGLKRQRNEKQDLLRAGALACESTHIRDDGYEEYKTECRLEGFGYQLNLKEKQSKALYDLLNEAGLDNLWGDELDSYIANEIECKGRGKESSCEFLQYRDLFQI